MFSDLERGESKNIILLQYISSIKKLISKLKWEGLKTTRAKWRSRKPMFSRVGEKANACLCLFAALVMRSKEGAPLNNVFTCVSIQFACLLL